MRKAQTQVRNLQVFPRFRTQLLCCSMLSKIPERLMFPVIWFEQRASITPELALPLRQLLLLPWLMLGSAALLLLAGLGCSGGVLLAARRRQQRVNTHVLVASFIVKNAR